MLSRTRGWNGVLVYINRGDPTSLSRSIGDEYCLVYMFFTFSSGLGGAGVGAAGGGGLGEAAGGGRSDGDRHE
ncbi:hypothetical protein MKW98_021303 [Papaver atlanticum]|uniref:Uncharacterized protein n=1 Tax=Papaver atlanticum TaxID=357466 RepID=A0AAD4XHH8_9MAGN|nr:hypothetical protein MKW98_021303 [Papaver atlanticum]